MILKAVPGKAKAIEKDDVSADIRKVLANYHTVAVVGASPNTERPSYRVADFLKQEGFRVIPVTPNADKVVGEKAYPDLASIPVPVEVVDIFRKVEAIPAIVDEAIAVGAKAVWLQLGLEEPQVRLDTRLLAREPPDAPIVGSQTSVAAANATWRLRISARRSPACSLSGPRWQKAPASSLSTRSAVQILAWLAGG